MGYVKTVDDKKNYFQNPLIVGGMAVYNPTEEQLSTEGYVLEEYIPPNVIESDIVHSPTLEERIEAIENAIFEIAEDIYNG